MIDERPGATQSHPASGAAPPVTGGTATRWADRDRFVGRLDELARIGDAVAAARRGAGSFFLISGEAGIGKTRLSFEASSEARANDVRVVWGRCWEAGGAPAYWPWIEVLRLLLADGESSQRGALGHHAPQLARLVPEAFPDVEPAAAPADPESGRFLLFDAVATVLRLAAKRRPVLVVIDDIHAADRASALLLAFLGRSVKDCGVVLIGTYRDTEAHATPELIDALGDMSRSATRLALRGLATGDVRSVLECVHGTPPGDRLVDRIHRTTDGNPFFVREIGRLLPFDSSASAAGTAFAVPDGIRETVRRRLQPLDGPVHSLLAIAAVVGREFDCLVVSRAARLDMIRSLELLESAIAHAVVDAVPGESVRFSFRHALIQETIYDDLAHAVRIRLHGDVRDALEQLSVAAPERYVAELAHHALAAAPADHDERFVAHGAHAARIAMERMAFEEAVRLYERTIEALVHARPDERRRYELLLALGEAKEWANDRRGSRTVIDQAADIARALDAPELLARAALAVGGIEALKETASSRCETAANLVHEALAAGDRIDRGTRARLRSRLALHALTSGNRADALGESFTAVSDARSSSDPHTLAHALIARHAVLLGPDHLAERGTIAAELLAIAKQLGNREYEMRGQALRVVNALDIGDIGTVEEATAIHERLAEATQDPFERWANVMWRCAHALLTGRFDEAIARANQGIELTRTVPGPHSFEVNGPAAYLGQLLLIEDTRLACVSDPGLFDAPRAKFQEVLAWHVARLQTLTRLRRIDEVRFEIDRLMAEGLPDTDRSATWLVAVSTLAEAIALVDDRARAAELYPKLLPYADHNVTVSFVACRGSMSRFIALLAATQRRRDDAARYFEKALAMNRRMGALPHVAVTLYEYAVTLRSGDVTTDDVTRSAALCSEALRIAGDLGMESLVIRCNELLASVEPDATRPADFQLIPRGSFWALVHGGGEVVVRDRKGLHYIAELLRNADRDVHSRDLAALFGPVPGDAATRQSTSAAVGEHAAAHTGHFSEALVDRKARRAYQRRLAELEDALDTAARCGDPEEMVVLEEERHALERELARITGLGGRDRRADDAERIRIAVTRAIRNALAQIASEAPGVGAALAERIRTGAFCRYSSNAV